MNGPLAFEPWEDSAAGVVSTVTAAQRMLFRTLALELRESAARVLELVSYAFLRERRTQPGSPLSGEDVGTFVAALLAEESEHAHGTSIHLKSPEQVAGQQA